MGSTDIRVFIADDQQETLTSLSKFIHAAEGMHVVGTAADGGQLRRFFEQNGGDQVDVALIDIGMPIEDGLTVLRAIKERYRDQIKLIAITGMRGRNYPAEAMFKRADGFIAMYRSYEEIVDAIRQAHSGEKVYLPDPHDPYQPEVPPPPPPELSPMEERVLYLIGCRSYTNYQTAQEMKLSQPNMEKIRNIVMKKFGATNAVELGKVVERLGFCTDYETRHKLRDRPAPTD
ncbi:MAG: response regulator transcription factor [Saprospiraceae bacterium]|nr:response regulator transcription factor [Saprospiraceae bacterium]